MDGQDTSPSAESAINAFTAELTRRRNERGLSKKQLALRMAFDPSYVSHVESGRHRPTEDFARRAEEVLEAGGAIWQRWKEYESARRRGSRPTDRELRAAGLLLTESVLIVERDEAEMVYDGREYRMTHRRRLHNVGREPVIRYFVKIAVDQYPDDPERSHQLYRENPLTWEELNLQATCGGEKMLWKPMLDLAAVKEVWLLFENEVCQFPLYPGERTWIEYSYTVNHFKWGFWYQRAVRLPTRHLSVRMTFPTDSDPQVWGTETSMTIERRPLRTPIERHQQGEQVIFSWFTTDPPLNARYRLEWLFRNPNYPSRND